MWSKDGVFPQVRGQLSVKVVCVELANVSSASVNRYRKGNGDSSAANDLWYVTPEIDVDATVKKSSRCKKVVQISVVACMSTCTFYTTRG